MSDSIKELLPFYALGVLNEQEEAAVASYLANNPHLQAELSETKQTISALAYAPQPLRPTPQLRKKVMDRIRADSRTNPAASAGEESNLSRSLKNIWSHFGSGAMTPVLVGLSLFIAVLAGIWVYVLQNEVSRLQARVDMLIPLQVELNSLQEENQTLRQEITTQRGELISFVDTLSTLDNQVTELQTENSLLDQELGKQDQLLGIMQEQLNQKPDEESILTNLAQELSTQSETLAALNTEFAQLKAENAALRSELQAQRTVMVHATSPGVQAMGLDGTEAFPNAHGQLIANPTNETAALVVTGLPPLQPGFVYKFWLVQNNSLKEAGIIEVDSEGLGILVVTSDTAIGLYDAMGISIEPVNAGQQSPNDMIMTGTFSS